MCFQCNFGFILDAVSTMQLFIGLTNRHSSQSTYRRLSITGAAELASSNPSLNIRSAESPASTSIAVPAAIIGGGLQKKAEVLSISRAFESINWLLTTPVTNPRRPSQSLCDRSSDSTGMNEKRASRCHCFAIVSISSVPYRSLDVRAP